MRRRISFLFAFFALCSFAATSGWCACTTSGSTLIAASAAESDVSACVSLLSQSTPTIEVPSGSATWTSTLSISLGSLGNGTYTIVGNGTPNSGSSTTGAGTVNTTLVDNYSSGPIISVTLTQGQTFRLSSFNVAPQSSTTALSSPVYIVGTCNSSGCPSIRVDNTAWSSVWNEAGNGTQSSWMMRVDGVYGVVDHNTLSSTSVTLANIHYSSWLGVGQYGDNSWAQPDSLGTASALYFENNTLNNTLQDCDETPGTTGGGCRIAVRYNNFTVDGGSFAVYFHGTDSTDRVRGGRQAEVYNNTVECTNTAQGCPSAANLRSGVIYNFGNTYTTSSGSWFNNLIELDEYRTWSGFPPWGYCAGQGPYDANDGTTYATGTISSVSTAGGTLTITDTSQSWSANQWVNNGDPYSIVDTTLGVVAVTAAGFEITSSTSNSVAAASYSQDYYNGPPTFSPGDTYEILRSSVCIDQPSRSGGTYISGSTPTPTGNVAQSLDPSYEWNDNTSGASVYHGTYGSDTGKIIANRDYYTGATGIQASATSPFNGTSGTGWGTLANRPATCTVGVGYAEYNDGSFVQLDKCTASNSWTSGVYKAFTYPHPLESGTVPVAPAPPTALAATAN
jgi:hypothetical protein